MMNSNHNHTRQHRCGRWIVCAILCLVLTVVFFAGCDSMIKLEDGIIMEGVSVAGVDVGGMTKEAALSALQLSVGDSYSTTPMTIHILDEEISLTPELSGVALNAESAIEAAYALGRTGSRAEQKEQRMQAMTTGLKTDITSSLNLDPASLSAVLDKLCADFSSELTQPSYEITGEQPNLVGEPEEGEEPDPDQILAITMGLPEFQFDLEQLCLQVLDAYQNHLFEMDFLCEKTDPDIIDLDAIYAETLIEPVDAVIDETTFEVTPHSYGYHFDLDAAKEAVANAGYGDLVEIPFVRVAPTTLQQDLSALLFRDVLSTYTAYQSSGSGRATNLRLACEAIDGTVLLPGEVFDYNVVVGERTPEKGYKEAAAYFGNETILTYGGGVCQPSSVIYYCALFADLEIVTRHCHTFPSSYVPLGMDATVSWGGPEFRFKNNTNYPLRIDAKADGGSVTIALVGTDEKDYYIDMEYVVLETYGWTDEYEDHAPGGQYKDGDVITTPYTGYAVQTYKCKYSKADDSLISREKEAYSLYSSRNRVIARVEEETEPEEETTEPTTPPTTEPPVTEPPVTEPPATEPPTEAPTDPPAPPPDSGVGEA